MKVLQLNGVPFTKLRYVYFRVFDKPLEKPFLDATDEQILKLLSKEYHETVIITKIEEIEVLSIIVHVPNKRKLDVSELKISISIEERNARDEKIKALQKQYPNK